MLKRSALIQSWNEVFVFQIKESDLKNPTEDFLTNAIFTFLEKSDFDRIGLLSAMNSDSFETRCKMRNLLCNYVEQILKIGNSDQTFKVFDLIAPTYKKTILLLQYLFNYHIFCEELTKEVIKDPIERKIQQKVETEEQLKKIKGKINRDEKHAQDIAQNILNLKTRVPELNEINQQQKKTIDDQFGITENLEKSLESLDLELTTLNRQENELKLNIITDIEIANIYKKEKAMESDILEIKEADLNTKKELKRSIQSNEDLKTFISCGELCIKEITELSELQNKEKTIRKAIEKDVSLFNKKNAELDVFSKSMEDKNLKYQILDRNVKNIKEKWDKLVTQPADYYYKDLEEKIGIEKNLLRDIFEQSAKFDDNIAEQEKIKEVIMMADTKLKSSLMEEDLPACFSEFGIGFCQSNEEV